MDALRFGNFTITEFIDVETYFRNSGVLDYKLEDLTDFTLDATQEEANILGRNGRIIGKKKKNKSVSGSGTSGVISPGLLRTQTGGNINYGGAIIKRSETKVISGASTTVPVDYDVVGDVGNEIGIIQLFENNGTRIAVFEQGATATVDQFSYDPGTKLITLPSAVYIEPGMNIVYSYNREVDATIINNPSNKFSQIREMWVHCFATDTCDNVYCADIYIPRADFKGDFSLNLGGDQVSHPFSFDALPDMCAADGDDDLFKIFIYTDDNLTGAANGISTFATAAQVKAIFTP